jgi:hypothetical protein
VSVGKSYSVTIDGKAFPLKYGVDEREGIEDSFPRPDGTPGNLSTLVQGNCVGSGGSFKVQTMIVFYGLRHHGKVITYEKVRDAMAKAMKNGGVGLAFIAPARNSIFLSGVLGKVVDPEPEPEGKEEPPPQIP